MTLLDEQIQVHFTLRKLLLEYGEETRRVVIEFQYNSWPDHGAPQHPTGLLRFVRRVAQIHLTESTTDLVRKDDNNRAILYR